MRYLRFLPLYLLFFLLLTGCKKDIEVDYHQVNPLYAVEASVSNDGMQARISLTNDMDDNNTISTISGATVVITGSDGTNVTLPYVSNGTYKSLAKGTQASPTPSTSTSTAITSPRHRRCRKSRPSTSSTLSGNPL